MRTRGQSRAAVSSGNVAWGSVLGGLHNTHGARACGRDLSQEMHFTGSQSCLQHRGGCSAPHQHPRDHTRSHGQGGTNGLDGMDRAGWDSMGGDGAIQERTDGDKVGWDGTGPSSPHLLNLVARLSPQQGPSQRHCWVSLHTCSSCACRGASAAQSSCREGRGPCWGTIPISRDAGAPEGHWGHLGTHGQPRCKDCHFLALSDSGLTPPPTQGCAPWAGASLHPHHPPQATLLPWSLSH